MFVFYLKAIFITFQYTFFLYFLHILFNVNTRRSNTREI